MGGDGLPPLVVGQPVAALKVGGEPEFSGPGAVLDEPVVRELKQRWQISGGVGGAGERGFEEGFCVGELLRDARGGVEQDEVGLVLEFACGLGEEFHGLLALGHSLPGESRLHAGRAVEQDDDNIRRGRERPAEPAAGERACDEEEECEDGERAEEEDEPLAELGVAGGGARGLEQEHHRRPRLRLVTEAVDEVNDHRDQDQRQAPKEEGLEEGHRNGGLEARVNAGLHEAGRGEFGLHGPPEKLQQDAHAVLRGQQALHHGGDAHEAAVRDDDLIARRHRVGKLLQVRIVQRHAQVSDDFLCHGGEVIAEVNDARDALCRLMRRKFRKAKRAKR